MTEMITIPKEEYDLFLSFKEMAGKITNFSRKQNYNKKFEPKEFFGVAKFSKKEIDKDLRAIKEEWK